MGFDLLELLGVHGFLLYSYLSPIANRRTDSYGGSLASRMRYLLEVAAAIREVWPRRKALGMRITVTDWIDGGITPDEAGIFAGKLSDIGFDYVCVSSGGINPAGRPAIAPNYLVPLAAAVKKASGIAVQAVGMIVDPHQAEAIVANGHADCVALARGFSTTRAGPGMPPLRLAPMPSTRRSTCAPARNIGRVRRLLTIDRRGMQLSHEPASPNDGPQPITDLGVSAKWIHDLARNPIPPNQIAAGRFFRQGGIIGCDRGDLGRLDAKALFDKLGGPHLEQRRRDLQSMLEVILRAVETASPWSLRDYRLNCGKLVRPQPPGRDAGGTATKGGECADAPAGGHHGPEALRAWGVADREAWHEGAPVLAQAPHRRGY